MARTLEGPERDVWQRPDEILRALHLTPTLRVADVGAGTGYFAVRLARAVSDGTVTATDVEPRMVQSLNERAAREGLHNLTAAQAVSPRCGLAPRSADRVLVAHVWHHHPDVAAFAQDLAASLRPDGRLFIVEFAVDAQRGPPASLRVSPDQIIAALEAAGLAAVVADTDLPDQYIVEACFVR